MHLNPIPPNVSSAPLPKLISLTTPAKRAAEALTTSQPVIRSTGRFTYPQGPSQATLDLAIRKKRAAAQQAHTIIVGQTQTLVFIASNVVGL